MEVTFLNEVGKSEVDALISEATKDEKIGEFGVSRVKTDGFFEGQSLPLQQIFNFVVGCFSKSS